MTTKITDTSHTTTYQDLKGECSICLEVITTSDVTWSCNQCSKSLHDVCAQDWQRISNHREDIVCPQCNYIQDLEHIDNIADVEDTIPRFNLNLPNPSNRRLQAQYTRLNQAVYILMCVVIIILILLAIIYLVISTNYNGIALFNSTLPN